MAQVVGENVGDAVTEKTEQGGCGMKSTMSMSKMISEEEREAAIKFVS